MLNWTCVGQFIGAPIDYALLALQLIRNVVDFLAQIIYNRTSNGAVMTPTAPFLISGGHNMKTIGVIPLIDYGRNSYWMIPGYLNGLQTVGALPIILPVINKTSAIQAVMEMCDGFLFTGGQDVAPALYHSEKSPLCGECSPERDKMEMLILDEAMKRDKPILGICRGIQFINAALGGTLWQDIPTELPSDVKHCQKPPYHIPSHDVEIKPDSPLYSLLKRKNISVNSYHHQGVRELSSQLICMAAALDGLIEAVYAPDQKFLWAVQWHPELAYQTDENSRMIFKEFVRNC